ncbi:hypothetical protein DER46DRAFT_623910 [Fusarium sp. MPI-SDFR-AT-0072]|nr:hypothetical protein DER46DRAFT_623910 [Fusarium sp. MPI-SDFR-AT-0072]
MSHHHLEELCSGQGDQIALYIRWNHSRLIFYLNRCQTSTTVPSIENTFLDRYNQACDNDDIEEAETISGEILDAVVATGRDTFDRLAPPPASGDTLSQDLHTLLCPKEYSFSFLTAKHRWFAKTDCNLPMYSTKDIHVIEDLRNAGSIAHITKSPHTAAIRVPKLLGLITTPENGNTIGFLVEYIPVSETWELSTLGSIDDVSAVDECRRKKWASQVRDTVGLLHKIGVTWGDGKASKVLIHREADDAWLIDFGGGWTEGWVDEELSGTVKGDEVAVRKIIEYLQIS